MNDKMKPALIGGVVLGILSAIPFVNLPNLCCCAWAIAGGIIAAHLYIKASPAPVRPGDGAVLGVLAGVVGAVIYLVIGVPLAYVTGNVMMGMLSNLIASSNPDQAEAFRMQMEAGTTIAGAIVRGIITMVLLIIFATIGGLIGVAIFEKRKGAAGVPPPPPPPAGGFGGPGPGGPASGGYGQGT